MTRLILITQGSQAIQLIRELFSIGYKPEQLHILTISDHKNICFINFLQYYKILFTYVDNKTVNNELCNINLCKTDLVISYSNPYKIQIIKDICYINFHPGLLPKYKGSLSTVYSLLNNEKMVGGTWHYMTDKIDCGNILDQFEIEITPNDTSFSLNHKIFNKSVDNIASVISKINTGDKGICQKNKGNFYYNKFPDITNLDKQLQYKINYFPPLWNKF